MVKKLRQGLNVTPNELRKLADSLEKEQIELGKKLDMKDIIKLAPDSKFLINIINEQEKCSDTWEIEHGER